MRNRLSIYFIGLLDLLQIVLLVSLMAPCLAQSTSETAKEKEQAAQEAAKIKAAEEKERIKAAIAAEKAKIARERALAIWRAHHPTPPVPKSTLPPPATTAVYFPDYLTSSSVLLPSTYNTKRNAYQSPNWYLCPQHGHGSGTKASPFCLDDLPVTVPNSYGSVTPGSNIMSTMKGGDTLVLLPGTYDMNAGSTLSYVLAVPVGTAANYTVVTAADPTNPPVLVGTKGSDANYFVGNVTGAFVQTNTSLVGCSYTIYENLVLQANGSCFCVWLAGNHAVVRNCDITGSQNTDYDNNNHFCIQPEGAQHCQVYDNAVHDNTLVCPNGTNYQNSSAIGEFDSVYLDVFHNNLYNNNGGTFNKDSGSGWSNQGVPVQTFIANGDLLPTPYSDLNAYRANYYHNGIAAEHTGTNQGPNDTIYVRDNVFAPPTNTNPSWVYVGDSSAVTTFQSYLIVYQNNLSLMPMGLGKTGGDTPTYTYFRNNITWSPYSAIYPIWEGYVPYSQAVLPLFMDNNIYLGPTGTTAFTTQDVYQGQSNASTTLDLQQMKQYGRELHSLVYSDPSQVFSDTSKYTLLPQFLKAASDGGAVGPRVAIDYISNPAWYGPNAPLNPYKLGISIAP